MSRPSNYDLLLVLDLFSSDSRKSHTILTTKEGRVSNKLTTAMELTTNRIRSASQKLYSQNTKCLFYASFTRNPMINKIRNSQKTNHSLYTITVHLTDNGCNRVRWHEKIRTTSPSPFHTLSEATKATATDCGKPNQPSDNFRPDGQLYE